MPWPVHPNGLLGAQGDQDTYRIERSLRFNSADSAYLNRTPATSTNDKTATLSVWIKRGTISSTYYPRIFCAGNNSSTFTSQIGIQGDCLFMNSAGLTSNYTLQSNQVLRDPSAWYHLVYVIDTANATSTERLKMYVNGVQVTSFSTATYPNQNTQTHYNQSYDHSIGASSPTRQLYYDGYITEIYWIDGQALTPSSFGETDAITGRWKAKAYSGTYGTNGFYLKFADNSGTTSTTLGKDSSPNGNNWTPNNFSVTAGAGNDSLVDSPTNYGTDSGVGGEVRGNYCTLNPLDNGAGTLSNGNLDLLSATASNWSTRYSSMSVNSGKWYSEFVGRVNTSSQGMMVGVALTSRSGALGFTSDSYGYRHAADKWNNGSSSSYGASYTDNDIISVALDLDNKTLTFYKNGVSQGVAFSSLPSGDYFFACAGYGTTTQLSVNFGQRPFAYTAPSGFKALCTANLPQPTIQKPSKYMDVVAYTGTGASNSISSLGFSPDLVWIKNRGTTTDHALYDTTRGTQLQLSTNSTAAEVTSSTGLTAFGSNGFTIGTSSLVNTSGTQYVAWAWDAGETSSTNTAGSITSTVRVNPLAGVSICTFNVGASGAKTFGHGLNSAPRMVIVKSRTSALGWTTYHASVITATNQYIQLNTTSAILSVAGIWGSALPTSSVVGIGSGTNVNANDDCVAYCFAEVEGFSKFGSYTGNGSADGPFVWCGFRPRWVMYKRTDSTENWCIIDTARDISNVAGSQLTPNSSSAEGTGSSNMDAISNGFKIRSATAGGNVNGGTYIFAAFAESPFKYARAR